MQRQRHVGGNRYIVRRREQDAKLLLIIREKFGFGGVAGAERVRANRRDYARRASRPG